MGGANLDYDLVNDTLDITGAVIYDFGGEIHGESLHIDDIIINGNDITSSTGTVDFNDDDLTTTGDFKTTTGALWSIGNGGAPNYGGVYYGFRDDTSISSGNTLFSLRAGGADGGANYQAAELRFAARGSWTAASQGTALLWYLTPEGSITPDLYYNFRADYLHIRKDNQKISFGVGLTDLELYSDGDDGRIDVTGKLLLNRAIATGTATITASADNTNVSGINTLFITTTAGNVVIGGFQGGVDGQVLYIARKDATNDLTLEHAEGVGTQDIIMHEGSDETIDGYGGFVLICDGSDWYDCSHAKHV